MNRQTLALAGGLIIGLAACSSPQPGSPAWTAQQEQKKQEARTETVKDSVSELPSWFPIPPTDEFSLYAPGTATSSDLQFAIDKAVLGAKRSLADRLNGKLSGKMKEFLAESGAAENAQLLSETERVTSNLITEVNLAGYNLKEKKIIPAGTQYRAYVLLEYPLGSANRILVDQVKKSSALEGKLRASKAFQELENEIREAKGKAGKDAPTKGE